MDEPAPDDLCRINGIGPAVADRLRELGVADLAHLAAASPEDLARRTSGWRFRPDEPRIRGWVEQARVLVGAGERAPTRRTFTLEVQTADGDDDSVVATRVVDVATQAFDTWPGWDVERLGAFVLGGARVPDTPPRTAEAGGAEPVPDAGGLVVHRFGVVESTHRPPGGGAVRVALRLPPGAVADGQRVVWDVVTGPAHARPTARLASREAEVGPEGAAGTVEVTIPGEHHPARVAAVVRVLGPGRQQGVVEPLGAAVLDVATGAPAAGHEEQPGQAALEGSSDGGSTDRPTAAVAPV